MDDLLKNGGTLLRKVSKNFSSTQMILGVAALAVVSIIVINRASQDE
jgi:recombination associated protein RdgC